MALIKLSQIKNGTNLFNSVSSLTELLISGKKPDGAEFSAQYDGAKLVGFTYKKEVNENYALGEGESVDTEAEASEGKKVVIKTYTVADALQEVKDNISSIMGDGSGVSLTTLDERLKEVETTQIADYIKITNVADVANIECADLDENGNIQYEEGTENVVKKSAVIDGAYPLYTDKNLVVYTKTTTEGADVYEQAKVTVASATATLPEGTFYVIDTKDSKTGYKEYTLSTGYKFFVKATLDLFDKSNAEFLLDNQEMQLVAQEQAIAELVKRLSEDEGLIKDVRNLISETAISNAIDEATHELKEGQVTLDARITANKDHADDNTEDIVALNTRLKTIEDTTHYKHVLEPAPLKSVTSKVEASEGVEAVASKVEITLQNTPVENSVKVLINGVAYVGNKVTVATDEETNKVIATVTENTVGFVLETTDEYSVEYDVEIPSASEADGYDNSLNATTTV